MLCSISFRIVRLILLCLWFSQSIVNGFSVKYERSKFKKTSLSSSERNCEDISVCIIGGGISGLSASIGAAQKMKENGEVGKIVLLEKQESLGGRVKSDYVDGYILDRGFAVFIEEYPMAKELLDYEELNLKKFWPGAKIFTGSGPLKTVVDPLRVPSGLFQTLFTPIGTMRDKMRFIPLFYNIFTKSIDDFFVEEETGKQNHPTHFF